MKRLPLRPPTPKQSHRNCAKPTGGLGDGWGVRTPALTEDLGIHQRHKISSESLKRPAGIALPRGGDAY